MTRKSGEASYLCERNKELEHAVEGLRRQLADHRVSLAETQARAERAEAERDEAVRAYCREHEVCEVVLLARNQLVDLLSVLDKYTDDKEPGVS